MWRSIWSVRGPPKLQHFLWSAVKGNFPVKDRLAYRHITHDASCQVCGVERETIFHALLECNAVISFIGDAVRTFATLMWAGWRCRNLAIFENEHPSFVMVVAGFLRMVLDYNSYAQKVFIAAAAGVTTALRSDGWKCPPMGCIKVNTDAHIPAGGMASLGVVFRDVTGVVFAAATRKAHTKVP
ncbi:uncharacterized protein LOC110732008 [Chenopodium quinoa]|uniref:uncharacterized protein LOC110732008 n=1 Tax=Chenopodium quinoa TaxID=63459 RepID=UPI000B79A3F3|nr:uncharacterized protein LOC110732008 [Chenopodium quinoa]